MGESHRYEEIRYTKQICKNKRTPQIGVRKLTSVLPDSARVSVVYRTRSHTSRMQEQE